MLRILPMIYSLWNHSIFSAIHRHSRFPWLHTTRVIGDILHEFYLLRSGARMLVQCLAPESCSVKAQFWKVRDSQLLLNVITSCFNLAFLSVSCCIYMFVHRCVGRIDYRTIPPVMYCVFIRRSYVTECIEQKVTVAIIFKSRENRSLQTHSQTAMLLHQFQSFSWQLVW